jgi:hypothetical protein
MSKKVVNDNGIEAEEPYESTRSLEELRLLKERVTSLEKQVAIILKNQAPLKNKTPKAVPINVDAIPNSEPVQWVHNGGGSCRLKGGRIIKPGQRFTATVDQIPKGAMDVIVPISGSDLPVEKPVQSATKYKLEDKGGGWWNVVNAETGKPMNEKGLREEDAKRFLQDLS